MKRICIFNNKKGQKPNQKEKESALHSSVPVTGLTGANKHAEKADAYNNPKDGSPNGKTSGKSISKLGGNAGNSGSVINCHFNHLKIKIYKMSSQYTEKSRVKNAHTHPAE